MEGFFFCSLEVIVYNYTVELVGKREFELGTLQTLLYYLGGISSAAFKTQAKCLYRRRLDENTKCTVDIELLNGAASLDINVENNILSCLQLSLHLRLQSTVKAVFIYLLILKELVVGDTLAELLGRKEEILHSVLLCSARFAAGA